MRNVALPLVLWTPHGPLWSYESISLMTGLGVAEIRGLRVQRIAGLPADVFRAGRRRSAATAARINTRDWLSALRYWAGEQFPGVELTLDGDGVWLPLSPEVVRWAADG